MTTPADAPPHCAGYVWGQGGMGRIACSRHGYAEHNGQWYCKMHHPPTIADRALARQRKENGERAANEERGARGRQYRDALGIGVPHWHTPIGGSLKGQGWTGGLVLSEDETRRLVALMGALRSLRERMRPGAEAAPWVIAELDAALKEWTRVDADA